MGKPRLIILVRHAQSEGNKNREIHQMIPDHRVKLTEDGWRQAEEAGRRLRQLLKPDDTLQIYTSPYRRTRETTEGILKTLTAHDDPDDPTAAPSPFSRSKITVYEEPRLREQDFGNFQPCSAEMERMWRERADYGHFFYRIPNGESAADAYDRVSGFNESMWRQFGDADFPSVCVLVTHGLMTRVFLMKWYHWSVEYFEDLRNINHCEFILMSRSPASGKYTLESQLRTWSELKRLKAEEAAQQELNPSRRNTLSSFLQQPQVASPNILPQKWGGCVEGCDHHHDHYPRRHQQQQQQQQHFASSSQDVNSPPAATWHDGSDQTSIDPKDTSQPHAQSLMDGTLEVPKPHFSFPFKPAKHKTNHTTSNTSSNAAHRELLSSGMNTPHEMSEEENDGYFDGSTSSAGTLASQQPQPRQGSLAQVLKPHRRSTTEDLQRWASESGMGQGRHADALGDEPGEQRDQVAAVETSKVQEDNGPLEGLEWAEERDRSLRGSVY